MSCDKNKIINCSCGNNENVISNSGNNKNINCRNSNFQDVLSLSVPFFESLRGRYFVGQTSPLAVNNNLNAWIGLVNNRKPYSNIFVNVYTITNSSDEQLTAEIWLNTDFPQFASTTNKTSPANTTISPLPKPVGEIRFLDFTNDYPTRGTNIYERIVPPHETLVIEEDGKFIIPPLGNFTIILRSESFNFSRAIVAFGWWEKRLS
jgi:hypothetical protein